MFKAGKVLTTIGIIFCSILGFALLIFGLGLLAFMLLGEQRYFAQYVVLSGYYAGVNILFLLDYILMGIGACGIPLLTVGLILKSVCSKKQG